MVSELDNNDFVAMGELINRQSPKKSDEDMFEAKKGLKHSALTVE